MKKWMSFFFLVIILISCKRPFESPVSQLSKDVLCIEGFVNTGGEASVITLTKLKDLKDTTTVLPELKAKVTIQEENGGSFALAEGGKGQYILAARTYDSNKRYRLAITRSNGKLYQSEYVKITTTPPIDKVYYKLDSNGVFILVDAHNAIDGPRYYYWDYDETWYYSALFKSLYKLKNYQFIKRTESIEYCYKTVKSNKLILGTTANLTDNIVKAQEINFADQSTGRLSIIYSILVKQHAIDKAYFEYLQKMKKNTEEIGSIFDAQPTQNTSNIYSVADSKETVIGYFNMHSVQQQRIYLKANELPSFPHIKAPYCDIQNYDFWFKGIYLYPEDYFVDSTKLIPINVSTAAVNGVIPECVDCRVKGGVLKKPDFWPY